MPQDQIEQLTKRVQALETRLEVSPPPVCPLCWDWILPGEQTVDFKDGPAHRRCWQTGEAAA